MPDMAKYVLWAGPEDGKEVDVPTNQLQYVLDSPSDTDTRAQTLPKQRACYRYNKATKKFEWKGYL